MEVNERKKLNGKRNKLEGKKNEIKRKYSGMEN